ncbi:MAG: hypothetical protein EB120_06325, partial [Proteobacteria bacterium]|nr:hypothetical protein [Pseudomonadota bacterium]
MGGFPDSICLILISKVSQGGKSLTEFYKKVINRYRTQIITNNDAQKRFDDIEFKIIKCININPNFLLILD